MTDESVFAAAAAIPDPAARAAYLDRACAADPALRADVEALLAAHAASNPLDRPPADLARTGAYAAADDGPPAAAVGDRVGPYRLMERIGEGGFGLVFVAEQTDPIRRKVAVKVLKPGMDTRDVVARFEAERQALALMDHPNIARVLDAGATDQGRPYFVMELVRGVPVTEFCDRQKLSPRDRLALFAAVCRAVQHAHQKGVIHRDLKPSNVLVTSHDGVPVPKVIDFGVAKAVGQSLTDKTIYTRFAQMIGTPLYMSPEQAEMSGLDVDTRTDVYALGVLLYELLTGTTPFDRARFREAAFDEIRRIIREEEPPRPSTRLTSLRDTLTAVSASRGTDAGELAGLVRGELDWIVMRALEKDRNRRYDSAAGLARDVERHLAGDAVEACPPTVGYRLRKFYRRNRAAVLVSGAFLLLTYVGASGVYFAYQRAVGAEREARENALRADDHAAASAGFAEAANRAAGEATRERDAAVAARADLRRGLYAATMSLVATAWKADHVGRAAELLDGLRPGPGDEDLRGFEWHYWDRQCRTERRDLPLDGYRFPYRFSGDGRRGAFFKPAAGGTGGAIEVRDLATGGVAGAVAVPGDPPGRLLLSRDGRRLAAVCVSQRQDDNRVVAWDAADGKVLSEDRGAFGGHGVLGVALSPDGRRLAAVEGGGGRGNAAPGPRTIRVKHLDDPGGVPVTVRLDAGREAVWALTFSPDGRRLAVATVDLRPPAAGPFGSPDAPWTSTVHVVDATGGAAGKHVDVPAKELALAFSPDGTRLAAATAPPVRTVVWEVGPGGDLKQVRSAPVETPGLPASASVGLAYGPDGRVLAVYSPQTPVIRLVDAETGQGRGTVKAPAAVRTVAFGPDGARLLAVCHRGTATAADGLVLKEWDVPAAPAGTRAEADDRLPAEIVVTSRDGSRRAAYRPEAREVVVRDRSGAESCTLPAPAPLRGTSSFDGPRRPFRRAARVEFTPNGRFVLIVAPATGRADVYEADTGRVRWSSPAGDGLPGERPPVFSPDGRWLALPDPAGVRVVASDDLSDRAVVPVPGARCTFGPDGRRAVCVARRVRTGDESTEQMDLWDLDATPPRAVRTEPVGPWRVTFSPDGKRFATITSPGRGAVWDAATGERVSAFDAGVNNSGLAFHPTGASLVVWQSGDDRGVSSLPAVWDPARGTLLFRLEGLSGGVASVAYSPDGTRIAAASAAADGEVKVWEAATGRELLTLPGAGAVGSRLAFSPDGRRLTLGDERGETVWDATPRATKP